MNSKFVIQKSKDGQWFFNLVAANNEVIATSEMYTTKQAAYDGIDAVLRACATAEIIEKS